MNNDAFPAPAGRFQGPCPGAIGRFSRWLAFLAPLCAALAPARETPDTSALELSEAVVKGVSTRDANARDVYPVTTIDGRRFAGRAIDLNEVVNRAVGVKVRAAGGDGSNALLNVRGLEGKQIKVYIDGHPLDTPDGSFGINDIPLQLVDRIEIYKGAVPARFGGDGLGGAVNVVLKKEHRDYTDASYAAKSLGNHNGYLVHKHIWREQGIELAVGGFGTHARNRYSMPTSDTTSVMRDHDGFESFAGGASLVFRNLGLDEVEFETAWIHNAKELQGVPGFNQGGTERNFRHARTRSDIGVLVLHLEDEGFILPDASLNYALAGLGYASRLIDTSSYVYDFEGNRSPSPRGGELGFGPNLSNDKRRELRQRITLGYPLPYGIRMTLHNGSMLSLNRPRDETADSAAGGKVSGYPGDLLSSTSSVTFERGIVSERLKLTASLKHHYFRSTGYLSDPWGYFTGEADRVAQDKQALGANAGLRYDILPGLWMKASVERAHRMPNAEELFGDGFTVLGSAGLKPESGTNLDFGILFDKTSADRKRYRAEASVYRSRLENLIKPAGTWAPNYANVAEARILGVEGEANADLFRWFYAYVNATYLDARDVARYVPGTRQENFTRGLRLPNMPYLFGNLGGEIHGRPLAGAWAPDLRLFWDTNAMHEFFYEFEVSRNQEKKIPGYLVHTAGLQAGFRGDRLTLSAEVENVGDSERRDQFSNPLPGRVLRAKIRVTAF